MSELGRVAAHVLIAALCAAGCGSSIGDDDTGGEPVDAGGGGGDDGADDGADVDAGSDDGGDDDDGADTGDCESDVIPMPTAAACAAATRTCLEACGEEDEETCADACFAADPDPEGCGTCLEDGLLACVNSMGCQPEWDALVCCTDACADPEGAECETTCAGEITAYDDCFIGQEEVCSEAVDMVCFPPAKS